MISIDLFGSPKLNKEHLLWQLRSQWIGKPLLTVPINIHFGIGIPVPKSFGKLKRKQALNQIIIPINSVNIFSILDLYLQLLENNIVLNKDQFYKISIEKFYSEQSFVKILLSPQVSEGILTSIEGVL